MSRVNRHAFAVALVLGITATGITVAPAIATSTGLRAAAASGTAVPGIAPPGADQSAVYLDTAGQVMHTDSGGQLMPPADSPSAEPETALIGCTPVSGRDNPHRSGGDVSGHGWWKKGNCDNNTAHVQNCLYEYYTDNTYRQKACSPSKVLKPGGGSSQRTVARRACNNSALTTWRNHVDVDVISEIDTGEYPYNQANVTCRVF
jgi:hypothetical protein